jgi:hypothetical protein
MTLQKTLGNGNKVFSTVETVNGVTAMFMVEMSGNEMVRKWKATFDDVAGSSPIAKMIGR